MVSLFFYSTLFHSLQFLLFSPFLNLPLLFLFIYYLLLFFLSALEILEFKFLLKPKDSDGTALCIIEEGPNRLLTRGTLQGDARMAVFKLNTIAEGGGQDVLDYRVVIKADRVSPFDLASSWRAYHKNLHPSTVRGIPDVTINAVADLNEVMITTAQPTILGVYFDGTIFYLQNSFHLSFTNFLF